MKEININDMKPKLKIMPYQWVLVIIGGFNWLCGSFLVFALKDFVGLANIIVGGTILLFSYIEFEFKKLNESFGGKK